MDYSIYPPDVQELMRRQLALSSVPQGGGGGISPMLGQGAPQRALQPQPQMAATPPSPVPNPLLTGNDALRQQFADQPQMQNWLDQREAHILGQAAPAALPPLAAQSFAVPVQPPAPNPIAPPSAVAMGSPAPAPAPALPNPAFVAPPPPPPRPAPPPMLAEPAGSAGLPAAPHPLLPDAPMLPAAPMPLPQQAPLVSQVSPAPKAPAWAQVDDRVTPAQRSFTPAYQQPALPSFLNASLVPNLGGYAPAPTMPGYALPRTGDPFRPPSRSGAAPPPMLPDFGTPFAGAPAGGPIGLGGGPAYGAPTLAQQPGDEDFYSSLLRPLSPGYNAF